MAKRFLLILLGCVFSAPGYLLAEGFSGSRAQALAATCSGCHNASQEVLPDLRSLTKDELARTLLAFKRSERTSTLMKRLTLGYSDEDLRLIAHYLGSSPKGEALPVKESLQ